MNNDIPCDIFTQYLTGFLHFNVYNIIYYPIQQKINIYQIKSNNCFKKCLKSYKKYNRQYFNGFIMWV